MRKCFEYCIPKGLKVYFWLLSAFIELVFSLSNFSKFLTKVSYFEVILLSVVKKCEIRVFSFYKNLIFYSYCLTYAISGVFSDNSMESSVLRVFLPHLHRIVRKSFFLTDLCSRQVLQIRWSHERMVNSMGLCWQVKQIKFFSMVKTVKTSKGIIELI